MAPLKKILITGGAGFIGSNLAEHLLGQSAYQIINVDALTYAGNRASIKGFEDNPNHFFVKGDINDRGFIAQILETHKPDCLIHLAAETHVDRSIDDPLTFVRTNVLGTANLLETALSYWQNLKDPKKSVFKFIHVSTDEVFGSVQAPHHFTADSAYDPHSPYSASKAAADHLVRAYRLTYGLPTLLSNCTNNFGPRQFPEKLIPLALQKMLQGEPVPVYGDGQNVRDWIYVTDHCRALERMILEGSPGQTYLVSAMNTRTNVELLDALAQAMQELNPGLKWFLLPNRLTFVADRPGHDRRYSLDSRPTQESLAWKPLESLHSGLVKTVRWYLENEAWCEQVVRHRYRFERLGNLK